MKVFISGAAGFIGSNLAIKFIAEGYEVIGYDNLCKGRLENLQTIANHANFQFVKDDVRNIEAVTKATAGCDFAYHLAAFKIPRYGGALDTLEINVQGTKNVAHACIANDCFMIFASTSDVYGKNPKVPFAETDDLVLGAPDVPRWAYALSKAYDEQYLFALAESQGLKFSIVRFFGGYGPHQHTTWWGGPQAVFINQLLKKEPITIHGDGMQTRSFTYVEDHVNGLHAILTHVDKAKGEVFNLGSNHEITIKDLAETLNRLINGNSPAELTFIPYEQLGKYEDVQRRIPDQTKSKKLLKFTPKWKLEDGLKITIEWQKGVVG